MKKLAVEIDIFKDAMKGISRYKIGKDSPIRKAVKAMDEGGIGFIACVDEHDTVVGILTDGDFRRAVLSGVSLERPVLDIANNRFHYLSPGFGDSEVERIFRTSPAQQIPVIYDGRIVAVITKDSLRYRKAGQGKNHPKVVLPVVIMAGGKGKRLDPFTRILPKALIPVGEKPVIEIIMDEYARHGMKDFYVSLNHKGNMIKSFFADYKVNHRITYIDEDKPLGTAGALGYLKDKIKTPFFVTNCDVVVKTDYSLVSKYHKSNKYAITIVGSMKHFTIPYGVCEIKDGGLLKKVVEKPCTDVLVNTGMYLLDPAVLQLIPENKPFNMTDLIEEAQQLDMPVGVFPISADSWMDIGQWDEYSKTVSKMGINCEPRV